MSLHSLSFKCLTRLLPLLMASILLTQFSAEAQAQAGPGGGVGLSMACLDDSAKVDLNPALEVKTINGESQVLLEWGLVEGVDHQLEVKVDAFETYLTDPSEEVTAEQMINLFSGYAYQIVNDSSNQVLKTSFDNALKENLKQTDALSSVNLTNVYTDFYPYLFVDELKINPSLESAFLESIKAGMTGSSMDVKRFLAELSSLLKTTDGTGDFGEVVSCVADQWEGVSVEELVPGNSAGIYGEDNERMLSLLDAVKSEQLAGPTVTSILNDRALMEASLNASEVGLNTLLEVWSTNPNVQNLVTLYQQDGNTRDLVDAFFETTLGQGVDQCIKQAYGRALVEKTEDVYLDQANQLLEMGYDQPELSKAVTDSFLSLVSSSDPEAYQEARHSILTFINDYLALENVVDEITDTGTPFADEYYNELDRVFDDVEGVALDVYRDGELIATLTNPNTTQFVDRDLPINDSNQAEDVEYKVVSRTQCNQVEGEAGDALIQPQLKAGTLVDTTLNLQVVLKESRSDFFMDRLNLILNALQEGKVEIESDLLKQSTALNALQFCETSKQAYNEQRTAESLVEYGLDCFAGVASEDLRSTLTAKIGQLHQFLHFNAWRDTDFIVEQFVKELSKAQMALAGHLDLSQLELLKGQADALKQSGVAIDELPGTLSFGICDDDNCVASSVNNLPGLVDELSFGICDDDNCVAGNQTILEQLFAGTGHADVLVVTIKDSNGQLVQQKEVKTNLFGVARGVEMGALKAGETYTVEMDLKNEPFAAPKIAEFSIQAAEPVAGENHVITLDLVSESPFFYGDFDQDNQITTADLELWSQKLEEQQGKSIGLNLDGLGAIDLQDVTLFQENFGDVAVHYANAVTVESTLADVLTLFTGDASAAGSDSDGDGMGDIEEYLNANPSAAGVVPGWVDALVNQ